MPFHAATADDIMDAAGEVRDGAEEVADEAEEEVVDFVESSSETISPYVESGEDFVTKWTNEATDEFLEFSDFVYHEAEDVWDNPVRTGENMINFIWGGTGQPPQQVNEFMAARGFQYAGTYALTKVCSQVATLGAIGNLVLASSGGPMTAVAYTGAAGACEVEGIVSPYVEDVTGCVPTDAALYIRTSTPADIAIVPVCS